MFAALLWLDLALPGLLAIPAEPPELVLSGDALPAGAVARYGIPHKPFPNPHYPFAAAHAADGSFRIAVADGKDVRVWTWHAPDAKPPKHLLTGLTGDVMRVAMAPDGGTVAAADQTWAVRVWDVATGEALFKTRIDVPEVYSVPARPDLAVSPGGRFVFVPGPAGFAIWDTTTGKKVAGGGAKREFVTAAFSPDGKLLATADKQGKLDLWESASGKRVGELPWAPKPPPKDGLLGLGPKLGPGGAPILPERQGRFGLFYAVDPVSPEHDGGVLRVAFSGDGKRVVAGGATVVRAWDVAARNELWMSSHSYYSSAHGNATVWVTDYQKLTGMDVSGDGKYVATADVSNRLRLLDAATGKDVWVREKVARAYVGVAFHPNGKWLTTHSAGNIADLWDIKTGLRLATTGGHTAAGLAVAFSPDGAYLAGFGEDRFLDVFDLKRGRPSGRVYAQVGHGEGFGFTADGKYLVTGGYHSHGQFQAVEFTPGPRAGLRAMKPESWFGVADALCIDPREPSRILAANKYHTVVGVGIPDGKQHGVFGAKAEKPLPLNDELSEIAVSKDTGRLVVGFVSYARRPAVIDLKTAKEPYTLDEDVPGSRVAITADGKLIVSLGHSVYFDRPTLLRIWDGETGKAKHKFDFGNVHHGGVAFSGDGKLLAACVASEVVLIDTATGKELGRAKGHRGTAWGAAFSPDGKGLATTADDGQVLVWDVAKLVRPK